MTPDLEATDTFHQFVLLAVIDHRARDDVPVHSFDVTGVCEDLLEESDSLRDLFPGGVTRQRVIEGLNELADEGHLGSERTESATGKGRPAYSLAVDEAGVLDHLGDHDDFATAVELVRERRD